MVPTTTARAANRYKRLALPLVAVIAIGAGVGVVAALHAPARTDSSHPVAGSTFGSRALLAEARRVLNAARSTEYQHATDVDEQTGTFDFDCSGFVDYLLRRVDPTAYEALPFSEARPLAQDIVATIRHASITPNGAWQRVPTVDQVQPGDLVSWLEPEDADNNNTGHVMIVLEPPARGPRDGEWLIHVADSTTSPHADDTRIGDSRTGLGTGTIGLVTDQAGRPVAYYWRGGVSTKLQHTEIALGRPNAR